MADNIVDTNDDVDVVGSQYPNYEDDEGES
jgi:hypothetical protein